MKAYAQSKFGPLSVQDHEGVRQLILNGQVQGGAALQPSAEVVRPGLQGPGPVSTCGYSTGWLAAAAANPKASMLMVGLGSGAGAVAVLFNFPDVTIDVVEVDPVIMEHALEWFPLVAHYVDTGRLRIHIADATDFVSAQETKWDLLLSDGYTGGNSLAVGGSKFYDAAKKCCGEIWLNWIGVVNGIRMMREFDALHAAGWSPETVFVPGFKPYPDLTKPRNWILTSQIPDAEALDAFVPYAELDGHDFQDERESEVMIDTMRQAWSVLLDSQMSTDELSGINLALA